MKEEKEARRSFLRRMLAGSAIVATSIVTSRSTKAKPQASQGLQRDEILYQETREFKKYYKTL